MTICSNFFTPQTISILFCLHQSTKQTQQINPHDQVIQFLIKKILAMTQATKVSRSSKSFEDQMLVKTQNQQFVEKYKLAISEITDFNKFYLNISSMLKTLRSLRNSKLQQANLVDFLIRRMYIYFQKLDFKEIIEIYHNFINYRDNPNREHSDRRQHEFMLTKSIQQIKFNLQNYTHHSNPEQLSKIIDDISQHDHTYKTSYLKGLIKAQQQMPVQSTNEIHRYFDKCLGNLFQQKTQVCNMSNKINHCILSTAYVNLKMGYLQQCLQSISQGLRISQNNTDEQSINNCIIYLYKIAHQLGKFNEQILLNEHAITHSLNLSNLMLMVYSCLHYSMFEKVYNCSDQSITLLKSRQINWTDALHFAKKKIYTNFQSNCKNIYHSYRSLLIPTFFNKLSVLIHIPQLQSLLINPYYQRKELYQLQIYQQYKHNTELDAKLLKLQRYSNLNQKSLLSTTISQLEEMAIQSKSPIQIIKISSVLNQIRTDNNMDTYNSVQSLIDLCKRYGFVKDQLANQYNIINKLLIKSGLYYDALVKIQETARLCDAMLLLEEKAVCLLLKAKAYIKLSVIEESISIVQQIEEAGQLSFLKAENQILFHLTKFEINRYIHSQIHQDTNLKQQRNALIDNMIQALENAFQIAVKNGNLRVIRSILFKLNTAAKQKANNQKMQQKARQTLNYCQKIINIYENVDYITSDDQLLQKKAMSKLSTLYNH